MHIHITLILISWLNPPSDENVEGWKNALPAFFILGAERIII